MLEVVTRTSFKCIVFVMERISLTAILAALLIIIVPGAHAQSARPQFEVASLKPYVESTSGPMNFSGFLGQPGGRFAVSGVSLTSLITYAYRIRDEQLIGGPDWTSIRSVGGHGQGAGRQRSRGPEEF